MKNQWPFWLFVVVIVVVVMISMNYQGKNDIVSLGDIFPEEKEVFDYEYVSQPDTQSVQTQEKVSAESVAEPVVEPAKKEEKAPEPAEAEVSAKIEEEPVKEAVSKSAYTVQVLSSKDKKAAEQALKKAQEKGLKDAYIQSVDLGEKGTWHRIYVGRFSSMAQAKESLPEVKTKYSGAFIIKF